MAVVTTTLHDATLISRESPGTESFLVINNPLSAITTVSPASIDWSGLALRSAFDVPGSRKFNKHFNRPGRTVLGHFAEQRALPPPNRISMAGKETKKDEEQEEEANFVEAVETPVSAFAYMSCQV